MRDVHSFARPDEAAVRHLTLNLTADFERRQLTGSATLQIEHRGARELVLDTNGLTVSRVSLDSSSGKDARFVFGDDVKFLGRSLTIPIERSTTAVHIDYTTSPDAAAVQWLTPEQTAGGEHPFLFTQSQAILARTWVPCQDTPAVRMTYEATVRVPRGLLAVMSAENPVEMTDGLYHFRMPQPIPSYLLALAVGDLAFRSLGRNSGVYAERPVIDAAAYEFADTQTMIEAAEKLYGPYRWGQYDILVLPPSFPFGGMENPRLTFATPTILAGDRSLVSLVAHELAHSWSGNLVTNATWNDFWLNEGFTTYFERRIMEALYGREYSEMLARLGMQDLEETVAELGADSRDTHLFLDLEGRDPDEGANRLAYEKGYFLLRLIEEAVGRQVFDAYLRDYFDRNAFKSMTSEQFVADVKKNLDLRIDIDEWVYGPGVPANAPKPQSNAFENVEELVRAFQNGISPSLLRTDNWSTHEWIHFLRRLGNVTREQLAALDQAFKFTQSGNSEILHEWLMLAIPARYDAANEATERFLLRQGRRKFLKPLYQKLMETDRDRARRIYDKARPTYHSVARTTIDALVYGQGRPTPPRG